MTKYVIMDGNRLCKNIREYIDYPPEPKTMNVTINGARRDKLFENPVTAIAYDLYSGGRSSIKSQEFDKKDIIKALDFWINDKVLENERLLKLNNELEDFHETELKDLIKIRETVLKLDNDTKFQRFIPDSGLGKYRALCTDTVEFYYIPTTKHDEKTWNKDVIYEYYDRHRTNALGAILNPEPMNLDFSSAMDSVFDSFEREYSLIYRGENGDEISSFIRGGRHSDDGHRRNWTIRAPNQNPNTWSVQHHGVASVTNWKVVDENGLTVVDHFTSAESAYGYIEATKERFLPSEINTQRSISFLERARELLEINNNAGTNASSTESEPEGHLIAQEGQRTELIGTAGESLRPGDLIYRDDNNMRWYKTRPINPPNSQGIRIVTRSTSEGEMIEGVREGLFLYPNGYTPTIRPGDSVGSDSNGNVIVRRGSNHSPPIVPLRTETPVNEFRNMYINSVNTSVGSTVTLEIDFRGGDDGEGAQIHCKFGGSNYPNWNIDNNDTHTLNILGNNRVLLDGTEYTVIEPVTVTYDRMMPPMFAIGGSTPITRNGNEGMDDFIDYSDMSVMYSESLYPNENDYVTCIMSFRNSLVDIEVNMYMTGRQIPNYFEHHNVRIYKDRKDVIEIDGERIHVLNMEIRYK